MTTRLIFLFYCVNFYLYNSYLLGQVFFISDFCKNELRFLPVTIFHLYPITIVDENKKNIFFICEKEEQNIKVHFIRKLRLKVEKTL